MKLLVATVLVSLGAATTAASAEHARPVRVPIGPADATLSNPARDRVRAPSAIPLEPPSRTIFLNSCKPNGCLIYRGAENSRTNRSRIAGTTSMVPAFPFSDDVWDRTVQCVKETYGRFDIKVTTTDPCPDPTSGCTTPHWEVIVAGSPADIHYDANAAGVSPFDFQNCSIIQNSMTYAFAAVIGPNVDELCWTIAQETAHSFGLDHEFLGADPMTYVRNPSRKRFQDVLADCGEDGPRDCYCRTKQNSVAEIMNIFGPAPISPPDVTIKQPLPGAVVDAGFIVTATVQDDQGVTQVDLVVDGAVAATLTSPPFAFNAPANLLAGGHHVEVRATDGAGTPGSAAIDVTVPPSCQQSSDCQAVVGDRYICVGGRCVLGPGEPGGLGDACDSPGDCSSGICVAVRGENHCAEPCDVGAAQCPSDFACSPSAGGGGFCVPSASGCFGSCAADGGTDPTLPLGAGVTAGMLFLRRKRKKPDILD